MGSRHGILGVGEVEGERGRGRDGENGTGERGEGRRGERRGREYGREKMQIVRERGWERESRGERGE